MKRRFKSVSETHVKRKRNGVRNAVRNALETTSRPEGSGSYRSLGSCSSTEFLKNPPARLLRTLIRVIRKTTKHYSPRTERIFK